MTESLAPHIEALTLFAEKHLNGGEDDELIRLKLDHSLHVLDNASKIVEGEGLAGHEAWVCRMAAIYHDIGRFPQFVRYHTFNDRKSVNHGRMGVLTLRRIGFPAPVSEEDGRLIRFTVGQHNVKAIRPDMPRRLAVPVKVVRDADKLDIYRVMAAHFQSDHRNPEITLGVDTGTDGYGEEFYDAVMHDRDCDYAQIRQTNDFVLMLIGWFFRLNYRTTMRLAAERGHIARFLDLLPDDAHIAVLRERANAFIKSVTA